LKGCRLIARHNYGWISYQDLNSDVTLLKKENVIVSFWEKLRWREY